MGLGEIKAYAWRGLAQVYSRSGVTRIRQAGRVAILTYHRILTDQEIRTEIVQPGMYVRDHVFAMHLEYLRENFDILSLNELLDRWRTDRWNRNRAYCVITFDDGWIDNYVNAFPILKRFQIPATVFLPTDFIGTSRWFWPEQLAYLVRSSAQPNLEPCRRRDCITLLSEFLCDVEVSGRIWDGPNFCDRLIEGCKSIPVERICALLARISDCLEIEVPKQRLVMNWEEVREMSASGITFGSHSCSHRLMTQLSPEEVRREAFASLRKLGESGAKAVPVFCYPNGNYDCLAKKVIREVGYEAALSVVEGLEGRKPSDLWALRRISLHNDLSSTPSLFALALSGLR